MVRLLLAGLFTIILSGCALFGNVDGEDGYTYADVNESSYVATVHSESVDNCFIDVAFNERNERYVLTVTQFAFPSCERDIAYDVDVNVDEENRMTIYSNTLNGFESFSWIVYNDFDSYQLHGSVEENTTHLATIERE